MQKKLRLLKADRYAFLVCAQMMATMVVAYLEGRQEAKWLGCEQGAVPDWDDIVQELSDGSLRHTQVKRQVTDFSNEKAKRAFKTTTKKTATAKPSSVVSPKLPDLSAFDNSMLALGKWFSSATISDGKVRTFTIVVPDRKIKIKQELEIRHFEDFCALCRLSTTTPDGLESHAQSNLAAGHIFEWLTTWCEFTDWTHIHKTLCNLNVKIKSLENEIQQSAESVLEKYFSPASEAFKALLLDLEQNVSDAGAATPRQIFILIRQYLRSEVPVWTQYAMEETTSTWGVSGCAANHQNGVEDPSYTVPIFWNVGSLSEKRLKISVKYDQQAWSRDHLTSRLMRLALHLRGPGHAGLYDIKSWSTAIKSTFANTLGVTSDDFSGLQWIEAKGLSYCIDSRQLLGIENAKIECDNFDLSMSKIAWLHTKTAISRAIQGMSAGDLQIEVDKLWQVIYPMLDSNLKLANNLLERMLSPASEKLDMFGVMRVGPRTVEILADGLIMLMITAVALKRHTDVASLLSGNDIRVIALRYWGGPASSSRSARILIEDDDDAEVEDFLGKELANIVLLSGSSSSHSEVNRFSIASDRFSQDSFGASRRAMLAVTNSRKFRQAVKSGKIEMVAKLLEPEFRLRGLAREENIMKTELTK
ncbi:MULTISPECIES: ABC-three component system protein [Pseudescherichia]|uniref:ABC-three component system protein n=1 Tax=Pseudescherichia TaxID=2055880 RepID=UPI001EDF5298|nr:MULTISPECIES: ABC-three component system protein [Pseudescherichia]